MENTYVINAKIETNNNSKNIEYVKPPLTRRIFANLVDIIIFAFIFVSCFAGLRLIITSTNTYQENNNELTSLKLDSGLFVRDTDNLIKETTIVLDNSSIDTAESRRLKSIAAIDQFFKFSKQKTSDEIYQIMKDDYKSFLLNCKSDEGINLFINDGGDVVENPDYITTGSGTASPVFKNYYENAYKPYINEHLQNYLVTAIPGYLDLNKYIFNVLLFAEILPSFVIGLILTYLVPTLIFSRGRMTFGKKIYRIGLLDDRCLSPSLLRTLARFGVIVLEFVLAIPTFCVSFLISFSMMVFSKSKQSVPDYVAGVNEILILENKIYKNFNELDLDNIDVHKEPVKFTTKNFD